MLKAVLPLAGGRFLRPTKEGGGRRGDPPGPGVQTARNTPPPGSFVAGIPAEERKEGRACIGGEVAFYEDPA